MKRTLLYIVLAVSLTFNVFFALGLFRALQAPRTIEEKTEFFAQELDLTPEQRTAYDQWRAEYLAKRSVRVTAHREDFDRAVDELLKDTPDEAVIEAYVGGAPASDMRRDSIECLRALFKILTPEQRSKIVELFRATRTPVKKNGT